MRTVAASLIDLNDNETRSRSVSRSEALELLDDFIALKEQMPIERENSSETTLCLSRDLDGDFLELSAFGPGAFNAQFRLTEAKKILGLIPTRRQENYNLLLRKREEAAKLIEAYMAAREPAGFAAEMQRRGAGRFRQDL